MSHQESRAQMSQPDQKPSIHVEIWSDYLCPWCFIGEWNMTNALKDLGVRFTKEHKSFQTNPGQRTSEAIYDVARKHGMPLDAARQRARHIEQIAKQSDLTIHMDTVQMVDTFDAHCLVAYAKTKGREASVSDGLMEAAFVKGWDISDIDSLADIAVRAGLDEGSVRQMLLNKEFKSTVEDDIVQGRRMGIRSVPYYRINGRFDVSGANSKEQFKHSIQSVLEHDEKLPETSKDGTCGDGGCIIS